MFNEVKRAMQHGAYFVMSKVSFVEDAKRAYVSCPFKDVVDLSGSTKMDRCASNLNDAVQPTPTTTVAGSSALDGNQFFDITALVLEVEEVRQHPNNRSSFGVKIYDGSLDAKTQKVQVMPVRFYFDTVPATDASGAARPASGEFMKKAIDEHYGNKTAMTFFCLSGNRDDGGKFAFRNTRHTRAVTAIGHKAQELNNKKELHQLEGSDTMAFELQTAKLSRDWSLVLGSETRCGLLNNFARSPTDVPEIDEFETVWQVNWVRINEPSEGQTITNQYGSLWLQLTARDDTGTATLYITEKAALKLTSTVDAAEFTQLYQQGTLRLPFYASIKVLRKPGNSRAVRPGESPSQSNNDFDCYIVDADAQDMTAFPSARSLGLLSMLDVSAEGVLPAKLAMIQKSEHYTLAVEYVTQQMPPELTQAASKTEPGVKMLRHCSRAIVLVESNRRSQMIKAGDGYKLVTENVVDGLSEDGATYRLVSFCTLENVTDFKLDPPKSGDKITAALISVSRVMDADPSSAEQPIKTFLVDDVRLITGDEAKALKGLLPKMITFGALAGQVGSQKRSRDTPWTPQANPLSRASKCRCLGRSPRGDGAVPDYKSP